MKALVPALVAGLLLVPLHASADERRVRSDACPGDSFLEMRSASHGHAGDRLVHEIVMCQDWANEDLSTKSNIKLRISVDDDPGAERRVKIDVGDDGTLYAELWNSNMTKRLRELPVARPDDRSVEFSFKAGMLRRFVPYYDWNAMTVSHGCDTPAVGPDYTLNRSVRCWSYLPAPGEDKVRHQLR